MSVHQLEPIIYKLSEFKKTQVMKKQHVLLKIKETKYCSIHCHALEPSNVMPILNSKAPGHPILVEHIATMYNVVAGRNILPLTKYVYNSSKSALLALAYTNTDKIPAQISKTHRYVLPGRNICCFMGYDTLRSVFVNSPPPKPEVILTNFFAEPTVLLVPITSHVIAHETTKHFYISKLFLAKMQAKFSSWESKCNR
jgi:hypothetical protein